MLVAWLLLSLPKVLGQTSNAVCVKNETTSFLFNANNESPCIVWSKLQSLCLPSERFINVPPLADGTWGYNPVMPEEKDSLCQCNVVAYALMASCSWCQVGDVATWVTEERWRRDCSSYNETSVSFAQIVLPIPGFAFHPWQNRRWDASAARAASRDPRVFPPFTATTTLFRAFPPASSNTSPLPSSSSDPESSDSSEDDGKPSPAKIGVIIGGAVGGVMLLIIIMLMFAYWKKQHRFEKGRVLEGKDGANAGNGSRARGSPEGLPFPTGSYAEGRGGGPTVGLVAMLRKAGKEEKAAGVGRTDRISRWSETFFTQPRKAPRPFVSRAAKDDRASRYTTTTERRRDQGQSSSTSGGSSFDATFDVSATPSPMSAWDGERSRAMGLHTPQTASLKPSPLVQTYTSPIVRQPESPETANRTYQRETRDSSMSHGSPRKAVPHLPPRGSFADRWSHQSSVFTFATSKTSRETLPSFSTSVKDVKDHRSALAKKVAADEARQRAEDDRRWGSVADAEPDTEGKRDSFSSTRDIVLDSTIEQNPSGRKSKKKGPKLGKSGDAGVDEAGVKLKKRKKKKRSSNTPMSKYPSAVDVCDPSSFSSTSARFNTQLSASRKTPTKSAFARRRLSTLSVSAPVDMPEYATKPLPPPPIVFPGGHVPTTYTRGNGTDHQADSIDFSVAVPGSYFPAPPQTARITAQTVGFPRATPRTRRRPETPATATPRSAEGTKLGRHDEAEFSSPRPSPHPTLPSIYEPRTGAGVYDIPPVPDREGGGRDGDGEVASDSGSPVSRYPVSILQVRN